MHRLLVTTALISIAPAVSAQDVAYRQLTQFASITSGNERLAFAFAPEYSDANGLSARGALGVVVDDQIAVGVVAQAGENIQEGLLNFGFEVSDRTSVILSGGQLRERLAFGTEGGREWVKQDEYGLAVNSDRYAFNMYSVRSRNTANFVGAKSYGAEIEASTTLSEMASLSGSLGYQRIEWNDNSADEESMTGSVDLGIQANDRTRVNIFADYNLSETKYGIGADWRFGKGSLALDYMFIEKPSANASPDDQRVALTLSIPLGGNSGAAVATQRSSIQGTESTGADTGLLLAEVMRRPEYLPSSVIAKAVEQSSGEFSCSLEDVLPIIDNGNPTSSFGNYFNGTLATGVNIDAGSYRAMAFTFDLSLSDSNDIGEFEDIGQVVKQTATAQTDIPLSSQAWMTANYFTTFTRNPDNYAAILFIQDDGDCSVDAGENYFIFNAPII